MGFYGEDGHETLGEANLAALFPDLSTAMRSEAVVSATN
jgi:hypothetical protein